MFIHELGRTCPRCGGQIVPQTWYIQVLPALGQMEDANRELHKDALGYGNTRFKIGYKHG